jgi:hypothetical protein
MTEVLEDGDMTLDGMPQLAEVPSSSTKKVENRPYNVAETLGPLRDFVAVLSHAHNHSDWKVWSFYDDFKGINKRNTPAVRTLLLDIVKTYMTQDYQDSFKDVIASLQAKLRVLAHQQSRSMPLSLQGLGTRMKETFDILHRVLESEEVL